MTFEWTLKDKQDFAKCCGWKREEGVPGRSNSTSKGMERWHSALCLGVVNRKNLTRVSEPSPMVKMDWCLREKEGVEFACKQLFPGSLILIPLQREYLYSANDCFCICFLSPRTWCLPVEMMLLRRWGRIWRQEELCKHSDQQRDSKVKELSPPWFTGALRDESQLELGLRLGQTKIEHIRVLFSLDWQWDLPSMLMNRELQRYQTSTCIGERLPKKQEEKK